MEIGFVVGLVLVLLAIVIIQFIVMVVLFSKNKQGSQADVNQRLVEYAQRLEKNELTLREEFGRNREETNRAAKESRDELSSGLKENRKELSDKIEVLTNKVDTKLAEIQKNNDEKLEKMRGTVEEKLQKTVASSIDASFKQVSENLERVQKGLGEMQNLATDVGGLKNVLTNVKNRGTFGEFQLGNIIEEMLGKSQYEEQHTIKSGSNERVDYAIKIPSKEDEDGFIWLPIDAKFPTENYERLVTAYDNADKTEIDKSIKALADTIKKQAKDVSMKYIDSPNTTEFAIMFLPFESLYAEVLRVPGLLQTIQTEYKITIAGPTTISAFLNSLQMGFKTLNVNKRAGEISRLLSAVKQEFGKFENAFKTAKQRIDSASQYLDEEIGVRTRKMASKLKNVDALPANEANKLLEITQNDEDDDV